MEMSEPVSASGDEGRRTVGRALLSCRGEGAGEVTLLTIRGQLLRSSIFCLDSVLSARALMLLNTTGRPPLWRSTGLQPCVNEVNIHWPHVWPRRHLGNNAIWRKVTEVSLFYRANKVSDQCGWPYVFVCVRTRAVYSDSVYSCHATWDLKFGLAGTNSKTWIGISHNCWVIFLAKLKQD